MTTLTASPVSQPSKVEVVIQALESEGAVRLPRLLDDDAVSEMRTTFSARLKSVRWNGFDGYERSERLRYMIPDVLTLAQGFVDLALHPLVKTVLDSYLGSSYALCEAKGWLSVPTRRNFHGWHSDAWYDQTQITNHIPREIKLAFYLTDVQSGAFQYITGTHRRRAPFHLKRNDVAALPLERTVEFIGPAGTAVLFDTSGIHRQAVPILEPRQAIFLNYHDLSVPLQAEDVAAYRYRPL